MISHTILQGIKNTFIMNKETQVFLYDKLTLEVPQSKFLR